MDSRQIIYPTERLLANPKIFIAIANYFEGPEWETIAEAFYDLVESEFLEDDGKPDLLICPEVCVRESPDDEDVYQVILSNGQAVELRSNEGEYVAAIKTEEDLGIVSAIYGRLIKAIEETKPEFEGDVALVDPPTPGNGYLRNADGNSFRGAFHLLSDPDKKYDFIIDVVDLNADDLRARISPQK